MPSPSWVTLMAILLMASFSFPPASAAALWMVMGAGNHSAVFAAQVGSEYLLDAADGSGRYVHAEAVEHADGPRPHSAGDDHIGAQTAEEARHHARPVLPEVWVGYDP
jgi:hypothetical protein